MLSGINRGANAGRAVLHSGTVGAALTAVTQGVPAMAVSLDVLSPVTGLDPLEVVDEAEDERRHWSVAAGYAGDLLADLPGLPPGTALNLNVPDAAEVRGLRQARLARFGQIQLALAESGERYVRAVVEQSRERAEDGTDLALLADGYATLTAIRPVEEVADVQLASASS